MSHFADFSVYMDKQHLNIPIVVMTMSQNITKLFLIAIYKNILFLNNLPSPLTYSGRLS